MKLEWHLNKELIDEGELGRIEKFMPDYALAYGVTAGIQGWMCYFGIKLDFSNSHTHYEASECNNCDRGYRKKGINFVEI